MNIITFSLHTVLKLEYARVPKDLPPPPTNLKIQRITSFIYQKKVKKRQEETLQQSDPQHFSSVKSGIKVQSHNVQGLKDKAKLDTIIQTTKDNIYMRIM
jgi:hypothetical protein